MINIIKKNISTIQKLCKKHRIAKLWLFGSAVSEADFQSDSDIDFLFLFDDGGKFQKDFPYVDALLEMKKALNQLLKTKIDLIEYGDFSNPYFKEAVKTQKLLLYDKKSEEVLI
ncbi:MAG: nucleotidyltransferase domain-containing protein [Bacteroidia bacterium]|nr:nucleotidyltransferase domain-containing protein [Bacteroidia bacterium]